MSNNVPAPSGRAARALTRVLGAATLAIVGAVPAFAQGAAPTAGAAAVGGFVVSGGEKGDWAFVMGPTGSAAMQMRLMRANADRSGAVGFTCSRADGAMRMAFILPGAPFEVGKPQDVSLTVGDQKNMLRVVAGAVPPAGQPPLFETAGAAVPAILKAMGGVADDRMDAKLTFDDGKGHAVSFGLTKPRSVAAEAAEICSGWDAALRAPRTGTGPAPLALPPAGTPPETGAVHAAAQAGPLVPAEAVRPGAASMAGEKPKS